MKMKTFYTKGPIRAVIAAWTIAVLHSRCLVDCFPFSDPNSAPLPFVSYLSSVIFTTFSVSCSCHPWASCALLLVDGRSEAVGCFFQLLCARPVLSCVCMCTGSFGVVFGQLSLEAFFGKQKNYSCAASSRYI